MAPSPNRGAGLDDDEEEAAATMDAGDGSGVPMKSAKSGDVIIIITR